MLVRNAKKITFAVSAAVDFLFMNENPQKALLTDLVESPKNLFILAIAWLPARILISKIIKNNYRSDSITPSNPHKFRLWKTLKIVNNALSGQSYEQGIFTFVNRWNFH